jgi:hypothetical protein
MTKNKPKNNYAANPDKVIQMDVCQTPPHALEPLYEHLDRMKYKVIWESAAGPEQLLTNALDAKGYLTWSSDLLYGAAFNRFSYKPAYYQIEITNVPFSIAHLWIKKAFEDGKPFAFLMPYEKTIRADIKALFRAYHKQPWAVEVLSPERRINFKMPNMGWGITVFDEKKGKMVKKGESAQMPTVWVTWGLEIWKTRDSLFYTYDVPMRKARYDAHNKEIE